jgi:hypothetical protein
MYERRTRWPVDDEIPSVLSGSVETPAGWMGKQDEGGQRLMIFQWGAMDNLHWFLNYFV